MIRIPFNAVTHFHLPAIDFTEDDLLYLNAFNEIHKDELDYRWYRYPNANKVRYHSSVTPVVFNNVDDFLTIDNFWDICRDSTKQKFIEHFTEEFFSLVISKHVLGIRMYLNNPNTPGVHLHKDIYHGSGIPRRMAINIPVSPNSLTSDLNLYDDELNLLESVHYQKNTPTALNTTVFHEVVHHQRTDMRKILTMSPDLTIEELIELHHQGRVIQK